MRDKWSTQMGCVLVPIVRICCPECAPMSSGPTIESLSELISSLSVEEHTRFKGFPAEKRFVLVGIINFCQLRSCNATEHVVDRRRVLRTLQISNAATRTKNRHKARRLNVPIATGEEWVLLGRKFGWAPFYLPKDSASPDRKA